MTQFDEPSEAARREWSRAASGIFGGKIPKYGLALALAFAIAGLAVIWATARTGSLGSGIALLRGDSIYASVSGPVIVDSNSGPGSVTVDFTNLSGQALRIVGYNNPCSCFSVEDLPLRLLPHERKSLVINMFAAPPDGNEVSVHFMSDCPSQRSIPLHLAVQRPRDKQE